MKSLQGLFKEKYSDMLKELISEKKSMNIKFITTYDTGSKDFSIELLEIHPALFNTESNLFKYTKELGPDNRFEFVIGKKQHPSDHIATDNNWKRGFIAKGITHSITMFSSKQAEEFNKLLDAMRDEINKLELPKLILEVKDIHDNRLLISFIHQDESLYGAEIIYADQNTSFHIGSRDIPTMNGHSLFLLSKDRTLDIGYTMDHKFSSDTSRQAYKEALQRGLKVINGKASKF